MENSENNVMTLDEIKVVFEETSMNIIKLYVNDVSSKLRLAKKIAWIEKEKGRYVPADTEGMSMNEFKKVYDYFIKSLPFDKASYDKYLAIGKNAKWLETEVGKENLPNDYNSLAEISSKKVMENEELNSALAIYLNNNPNSPRSKTSTFINDFSKDKDETKEPVEYDMTFASLKVDTKSFVDLEVFINFYESVKSIASINDIKVDVDFGAKNKDGVYTKVEKIEKSIMLNNWNKKKEVLSST